MVPRRTSALVAVLLAAAVIAAARPVPDLKGGWSRASGDAHAARPARSLPLRFEPYASVNGGAPAFRARGGGYAVVLERNRAAFTVATARGGRQRATVRMRLAGANPDAALVPEHELPGRVSYLIGRDPSCWRAGLPVYGRVRRAGVYPGVDLVYYGREDLEGRGSQLEYDFVVAAGADPTRIALELSGARSVSVDRSGDLVLAVAGGELRQHRPVAYQVIHGRRVGVPCEYRLGIGTTKDTKDTKGEDGGSVPTLTPTSHSYSSPPLPSTQHLTPALPPHTHTLTHPHITFALGAYDRTRPLVIDPVLSYASYLGGTGDDLAQSVTVDRSGNLYLAGRTLSTDFPALGPVQGDAAGLDAFVMKLDPTGTQLIYATYLGGAAADAAHLVKVDSSGVACVAGWTTSADFPTTAGAFDRTARGLMDVFVLKLNAAGSGLIFSTRLGGGKNEQPFGLALDASGNAYVSGYTESATFPATLGAFQMAIKFGYDAFVTKIGPTGNGLAYSTYLGGGLDEGGLDPATGEISPVYEQLALDSQGNVTIVGRTRSINFPVLNACQPLNRGGFDAFVAQLDSQGSALLYSTYLGGTGDDAALGVVLDRGENAWVCGSTASNNFPVLAGAYQTAASPGGDAFLARLNAASRTLDAATYLGGVGTEAASAVVLDNAGNPCIAGFTGSRDFPLVRPLQAQPGGGLDAFMAQLDPTAKTLLFCSPLGGEGNDQGLGMTIDAAGGLYLVGSTGSTGFPVLNGLQPALGGGSDGFLLRVSPSPPSAPSSLRAQALSQTRVSLTWADNSADETAFHLERRTRTGTFTALGLVGADVTTYTDTTAVANTAYGYRLRATGLEGASLYSNEVTVTTPPDPPAAPANLTATAVSASAIVLRWEDQSSNESGFKIERRSDGAAWAQVKVSPANGTSYTDSGLEKNTTYAYRIRATNAGGDSEYSNEAGALTYGAPLTPPSGLGVRVVSGIHVSLAWTDNSSQETGFQIERKLGSGRFLRIRTVPAGSNSAEDAALKMGQTYTYRVRAVAEWEKSAYSNEVTVTTPVTPRLSLLPGGLDFGMVAIGASRMKTVQIKNTGLKPLVVSATAPSAPFSAPALPPSTLEPGGVLRLQVRFTAPEAGSFRDRIVLTTNDPDAPTRDISLWGRGKAR